MTGLTFAMGPVHQDAEGRRLREALGDLLSRSLEADVRVISTDSYVALAEMMGLGQAQLGWMPPAVFVRGEARGGVHLLAAVKRSLGGYRGVLFVPADSPISTPEELAGHSVAWVDKDSCAGYLFVRLALRARGLDPDRMFSTQRFAGSHGGAVRAVLRGDVEAGATHAQTLPGSDRVLLAGWHPYAGTDGMRALLISEPIPPDVICASLSLDPDRLDDAREALLSLHQQAEPDLLDEIFGGTQLVSAAARDYNPVRDAMR